MKITLQNRSQVAAMCGGSTWADGVIVPTSDGEQHARVGDTVMDLGDAGFAVARKMPVKRSGTRHLALTDDQLSVLRVAVLAHRKTMMWSLTSSHATVAEKSIARENVSVCNTLLPLFDK